MSFDPNHRWSEAEDRAIREFYPKHGWSWIGWPEVIPSRTQKAIAARAQRLGITKPRKQATSGKRKGKGGDARHYGKAIRTEPDPSERHILKLMEQGMTTTEIDAVEHWTRGTAKRVLIERWSRERQKEDGNQ